jgi:hypothetical protein
MASVEEGSEAAPKPAFVETVAVYRQRRPHL